MKSTVWKHNWNHSPITKWIDKYIKDDRSYKNLRSKKTHSQMIVNLKYGELSLQKEAIHYFYNRLMPFLSKNVIICTFPGHEISDKPSCLDMLVSKIYEGNGRIRHAKDLKSCNFPQLKRVKDVGRNSQKGSDRSIEKHLDTIKVNNRSLNNKNILLIDDVLTTGNSLKAGKRLLRESGAKNVQCLALAQNYNKNYPFQNYGKLNNLSDVISEVTMLDSLKKWRLDIARKNKWAPFCICNNKTLTEICRTMPLSLEELTDAPRVSKKFIETYGEEILDHISMMVANKHNNKIIPADYDEWTKDEKNEFDKYY